MSHRMKDYEGIRKRTIKKNIDPLILYILNLTPPRTTTYLIRSILQEKFKYSTDYSTVKYRMNHLVEDGFIERDQTPIPREGYSHRITEKGREFLQFYAQMLQTLTVPDGSVEISPPSWMTKISTVPRPTVSSKSEWWEIIPWTKNRTHRDAFSLLPEAIKEKIRQASLI
jgi:DNA-binding PadR family transcriptional regulator